METLIDTAQADRLIAEALAPFATEQVALQTAAGRILRQAVRAETAQPPFDRVMMDGIAIRWQETLPRRFAVAGQQMAGAVGQALADAGQCIEVTTGAVLPPGSDCVIPVEQIRADGAGRALAEGYAPTQNQFIHRAGIDCARGEVVLRSGARILGPEMSMLASNGVATVAVASNPAIAVISTGDELVPVDAPLRPGQIRRSNDLALLAALRRDGFDRVSLHHILDDRDALIERLGHALETHQVLILSGGVSMGQRDYVPGVLDALGVRRVFHGIAQRPGKPMWFGVGSRDQAVFALPGNPVSSLVCAVRYVRPALLGASGLVPVPEHAQVEGDAGRALRLARFLPARLSSGTDGMARAHVRGWSNSGDFTALGGTQGFLELPADRDVIEGEPVPVFRW